ncbi:dual specificity protein phosphatase 23b isoform X2 [Triplophysa rosa]|uniref:dual specificity protein phosphatase 23b isoform X2 n=1 Tax=Triplophysa rosa TaxID=992332 RepID=UPI0025463A0A|nr:dual specificity protein phosphatase 23b isoform X2 [Triplophysa rosa]
MASAPPPNFSWVDPGKVAGLAMPRMTAHYQYLLNNGIKHLVSLSERKPPYHDTCPDLTLHHIKIHDFCSPTSDQIKRFLSVVEEANAKGQKNSLLSECGVAGSRGALYAWFRQDGDDARLLPGEKQENEWNCCYK